MFYIGIDVAKNSFQFCILHPQKGKLVSKNLPMSSKGFEDFLQTLSAYTPNHIVLESSGRFHLPLLAFLLDQDFRVSLLNPKMVHHFVRFVSANNPSKSDKKDAFLLALFALSNPHLLKPATLPSETKLLARQIQKLKQEIAEAKTQIKHSLAALFPEAEKHFNVFSRAFLEILSRYPSAKRIAKAGWGKIDYILSRLPGRKPSFSAQDLVQVAQNSVGISHKGLEKILQIYIQKIFFLQSMIEKLEKDLQTEIETTMKTQLECLSSIKGISRDLASRFLAEVENIKRFSNAKKLIKYAGTDPVVKQSGKWKVRMNISKQGNPYLRNILFQMAVGTVKWEKTFQHYFRRKYTQFRSYKKAMIAVVNKLIRVIYALSTRNQFFDPSKLAPAGVPHA
ncbi:IS110 family transposase [Thermosulfurimonas sp. F29]|uniref:IS110 family transposase n=1 Tax=Thermosulfurimonas sp. F29 TaxID=2867247 RepID=UPI001C834141|nr:IS110 family transposase [Thermosulfurimonas sp. F29]MBX6421973.1 IS110 family transposase [Thermosulfurimonas sp. F29]MBX6422004.1 IS110 family transposase [Thermosulfurimonas sp. F29]MBX6422796.1 IS110 family transposase [Thermosulfurimonas sp. F29]MBX6423524.1 IS110 family transposase [Thermosulfurimonas sp. F29]MBX6424253.1 IS110 family transposase [Thermosulfurimonas sp. F29]